MLHDLIDLNCSRLNQSITIWPALHMYTEWPNNFIKYRPIVKLFSQPESEENS